MTRDHISNLELVGRLGQQPDLRYMTDGTPYVQLSVATSEGPFTDKGGAIREKTEWHRAVAFGDLATKIASDFDKGHSVALTGAMRINSFEKDGVKHRTSELHIDTAEKSPDKSVSRNEARLIGQVREDPRPKQLDNGASITVLSIATKTVVNGKEREDWHSVTLWGRTAEAGAREIKVGDTVSINGALRHRSVPDQDGNNRKLSAIECSKFQVLERARERTQDLPREREPERSGLAPGDAPEKSKTPSRSRSRGLERDM